MPSFASPFVLTRLAVGTSLFGHGLVRLPKLEKFSHGMADQFQHANSILPPVLVLSFGYVLPFLEFGIGLLLLLGLFTRQALIGGTLVMIALIFGSTTIENWDIIPSQLLHIIFCVVLLAWVDRHNIYALDNILAHSSTSRKRSKYRG